MTWFDRFRRRGSRSPTPGPSAQALADLREFMESRTGVEAFIEPPTSVYAMSLCLVAGDGEYVRRPVKDARQANQIAEKASVPIYDARIVGYPRRMRDYDRGVRARGVTLDELPPLQTAQPPPRDDDTR